MEQIQKGNQSNGTRHEKRCKQFSEKKNVTLGRNTPGSAGGPGGRDRALATKSRQTAKKKHIFFFLKKNVPKRKYFICIYLLVMPKYWVKKNWVGIFFRSKEIGSEIFLGPKN